MSPLKYIFERGCFLIILKCGMKQEAPSNLGEDIAKAATKRAAGHQCCASFLFHSRAWPVPGLGGIGKLCSAKASL